MASEEATAVVVEDTRDVTSEVVMIDAQDTVAAEAAHPHQDVTVMRDAHPQEGATVLPTGSEEPHESARWFELADRRNLKDQKN